MLLLDHDIAFVKFGTDLTQVGSSMFSRLSNSTVYIYIYFFPVVCSRFRALKQTAASKPCSNIAIWMSMSVPRDVGLADSLWDKTSWIFYRTDALPV